MFPGEKGLLLQLVEREELQNSIALTKKKVKGERTKGGDRPPQKKKEKEEKGKKTVGGNKLVQLAKIEGEEGKK